MPLLDQKRILLAVGGGISAYKAPDLVRRLQEAGARVQVMLTQAGREFVTPLALEVVSQHPVGTDLWRTDGESRIVHTDHGKAADLILIAPATANLIARLGHGFADDLVAATVLACTTPVLLVPAMNTEMWENPLTQENLDRLRRFPRFQVLGPDEGLLACGVVGPGRQPDAGVIIEAAVAALTPKLLQGRRITVSAGPTREALDPVRFLSNESTGTLGFALARSFVARGAEVTLVAGPAARRTPLGIAARVDVVSAEEMADAVTSRWDATEVLVMTAAVADYRPRTRSSEKLKKSPGPLTLELERTLDILAWTAEAPGRAGKVVVGFAAETSDVEARARAKLVAKRLDWIVANRVGQPGTGFGAGDNEGVLLGANGERVALARAPKDAFAETLAETLLPAILAKLGLSL
jgi:phosphopantothenoylcysteine decarboxylase/phosphopantothenate--cysteine ligase